MLGKFFAMGLSAALALGTVPMTGQPAQARVPIERPAAAQPEGQVTTVQHRRYDRGPRRDFRRHRDGRHFRHHRPGPRYGHHLRHRDHWQRRHWHRRHWRPHRHYYRPRPYIDLYVPGPIYTVPRYRHVRGLSAAHVRWCYNRYRSYRAYDNTFQPYHGPRRQCVSPYL